MDTLRHYLKAVSALIVQLVSMGLTWALTGKYSEAVVFALLVAFLINGRLGKWSSATATHLSHLQEIGEEKKDVQGEKRYPARRWVVERTLGWLSKCRVIVVRYEKKAANYLWVWLRWPASCCSIGVSIVYPF